MKKMQVFLDTNFLVANQIKQSIFHDKTKILLEQFISSETQLYIETTLLDEFWYVLSGIWNSQNKGGKQKEKFSLLKIATNNILRYPNLTLLNTKLNQEDLLDVLKIMETNKLRPRDALICKYMSLEHITHVASFDTAFSNIKNITVIK